MNFLCLPLLVLAANLDPFEVERGFVNISQMLSRKPRKKMARMRTESKYKDIMSESQMIIYRLRMEMNGLTYEQMDQIVRREGWLNRTIQ